MNNYFEQSGKIYCFAPAAIARRLWLLATTFPGKEVLVIPTDFGPALTKINQALGGFPRSD